AGAMTADERRDTSRASCEALAPVRDRAVWQHSHYAGDKVFCLFIADDEDAIREHAERGGFPITRIHPVSATTTPLTAEA
ncbi:DUF4242 domain-containing protein, partial [Enterococcus hirae]